MKTTGIFKLRNYILCPFWLIAVTVLCIFIALVDANDPNVIPVGFIGPPPKVEYFTKVGDKVRVTYSVDYSKGDMKRQLAAIDRRITTLQESKADIEKKLAVLER